MAKTKNIQQRSHLSGPNNETIKEVGTGKGSIEALYNTLEKSVHETVNLLDYRIQSVGAGRDALAQVFVKMNCSGIDSSGRGLAQDVLEASARAYLNAINRVLFLKESELSIRLNSGASVYEAEASTNMVN